VLAGYRGPAPVEQQVAVVTVFRPTVRCSCLLHSSRKCSRQLQHSCWSTLEAPALQASSPLVWEFQVQGLAHAGACLPTTGQQAAFWCWPMKQLQLLLVPACQGKDSF